MMPVTIRPARIPRNGFCPITRNASEIGEFLYGSIEPDIKLRPMNNAPNPTKISPTSLFFSALQNKRIKAPIPTNSGAKNSGFNTLPKEPSDTIQAVTVVPILAPIMTPTACVRFMIPAFTKPTTMTVVAELLWIMAVTSVPTKIATNRLFVR